MSLTTATAFQEVTLAANGSDGDSVDFIVGSPMEFENTTIIVRSDDSRDYKVEKLIGGEVQADVTPVTVAPYTRAFAFTGLFPASQPPKKRTGSNIEPDPIGIGFRVTNLNGGSTNRVRAWLMWQMCRGAGG